MGAETAESKRLSRTDSDSLLAVVSKDLEKALQNAFDMAGEFAGMEAPQVKLDRDFDTQLLDAQQVQQYLQMWMQGAITHETLLEMLKTGEILPGIDVEREVELVDQEKLASMDMAAAGGFAPDDEEEPEKPEEEEEEDEESDLRKEVVRRLKRMSSDNGEEDKN